MPSMYNNEEKKDGHIKNKSIEHRFKLGSGPFQERMFSNPFYL